MHRIMGIMNFDYHVKDVNSEFLDRSSFSCHIYGHLMAAKAVATKS